MTVLFFGVEVTGQYHMLLAVNTKEKKKDAQYLTSITRPFVVPDPAPVPAAQDLLLDSAF